MPMKSTPTGAGFLKRTLKGARADLVFADREVGRRHERLL
jgi:hypothetical protein